MESANGELLGTPQNEESIWGVAEAPKSQIVSLFWLRRGFKEPYERCSKY